MKNLETEYKNQIAQEVPDLWARIESSIDAIEEQDKTDNNVVSLSEASATRKGSRIKRMNGILRYSVIVASAACVLVVVLALSRSGKGMLSSAASYEATSDAADYEASAMEDAEEATGSKKKDKKKKSDKELFMANGTMDSASEAASAPAQSEYEAAASEEYDSLAEEAAVYDADEPEMEEDSLAAEAQITAAKEETIQGSSSDGTADLINVTGVLSSIEIVEYKGKEIYYATFTDDSGKEYVAFVPEELEAEASELEQDKVERKYVLSVSKGGYYDAEYVYEGYSK
ncbi:MAG: hypothetical protein K6A38_01745 [Lachnospiraceae bacterium]|nr:hypothetical protein [Lachnospiraceae bacterium]